MSELHTIQVIAYWGDLETYNDLHIIGPYPTAAARNRDLHRLERLKDVYGNAEFLPSGTPPADAYVSTTPEQVANATHIDHLVNALYGLSTSEAIEEDDAPTLFDGWALHVDQEVAA